jgi:hypothetical protein
MLVVFGIITFFSVAGTAISIFLLVRAAKRLLEYDAVFSSIAPALEQYAADLTKTLSSGILLDNPEVLTFHKRNVSFLKHVESISKAVTEIHPVPKKDPQPIPPRPDWE